MQKKMYAEFKAKAKQKKCERALLINHACF